METEKELSTEKEHVQRLKKKIEKFEEELYAKNLELDTINGKYTGVVESRDTQIRALQVYFCRQLLHVIVFFCMKFIII